MEINKRKIKVSSFSAELPESLDRNLRTFVTTETEIYEVAFQDQQDGFFDEVYRAKVVGATKVEQLGQKAQLCPSKRSASQKLRQAFWAINPDEDYYQAMMNKLIINLEEVIQFLKDK